MKKRKVSKWSTASVVFAFLALISSFFALLVMPLLSILSLITWYLGYKDYKKQPFNKFMAFGGLIITLVVVGFALFLYFSIMYALNGSIGWKEIQFLMEILFALPKYLLSLF